jgi:hypothetical protein
MPCWWNINWCIHCGKLKIELTYPAILLLSIYSKECKSAYNRDTCTFMFIPALFTIPKLWNQHRYLSTDEWIKKTWYIVIMEYYSTEKKNELMSFLGK